ncbi:hypothetical protein ZWY2020_000477 [Hordeum vulgare]|nr:hypothetical protein ZWY2020_000477 [Hordeum vulgare]
MARRLVLWRVLPPTCVPDNLHQRLDVGASRRTSTTTTSSASHLILPRRRHPLRRGHEGARARSSPPPPSIAVGSVLVLSNSGAAKHCIRRARQQISITFGRGRLKVPFGFRPTSAAEPHVLRSGSDGGRRLESGTERAMAAAKHATPRKKRQRRRLHTRHCCFAVDTLTEPRGWRPFQPLHRRVPGAWCLTGQRTTAGKEIKNSIF